MTAMLELTCTDFDGNAAPTVENASHRDDVPAYVHFNEH